MALVNVGAQRPVEFVVVDGDVDFDEVSDAGSEAASTGGDVNGGRGISGEAGCS